MNLTFHFHRSMLIALMAVVTSPVIVEATETYDVVVYGATTGGITAAIQTKRMGKTTVLIEPGRHVGGLTSGGLGATDIGNKAAIGGISREFYRRIKKHYESPNAWRQESAQAYLSSRQGRNEDAMWTFEPHVAEAIFSEMLRDAKVDVILQERLERKGGIQLKDGQITSITMESGKTYNGRMFVDATYEGDLMDLAKVRFHVGREANAVYQETLNGVQTKNAIHHQMVRGVDPYVVKGDKSSGLLPGVHAGPPGEEGSGDKRVQTYNFRMCLTDNRENQIPFAKPDGYDEKRFELLFRNFEAGETRTPWSHILMPNRKTDINNNFGFSTDNIGMNYDWPTSDYATREQIFQEHLLYQRGLMWTLANHPRVPEKVRNEIKPWGLAKDEFPEFAGWPHQLYVREGRRMISDYVMTQHNCQGRIVAEDSVGLAAYTMDSHNTQRYVDANGEVRNEGDVQVGGFPPYPISFRSIRPDKRECQNLLVPVSLSASHIAYGSIRMEPVFMVLGQSAATAACIAIDAKSAIQDVEYATLRKRLLDDQQILEWKGPRPNRAASLDPSQLPGIVLDDQEMVRAGNWSFSSSIGGFVGNGYWHDGNQERGEKSVAFSTSLKSAGEYEVRLAYTASDNRATNVTVVVKHSNGESKVTVNQRKSPPIDKSFISLGTFSFNAGANPSLVTISNSNADGYVVVDAVQLLRR